MGTKEEVCKHPPGRFVPMIDRNSCEGRDDCMRVCPYHVFDLRVLTVDDRRQLSLKGKLKGFFHGYRQAFADRADACHGCGLCVSACPEQAIRLVRSETVRS